MMENKNKSFELFVIYNTQKPLNLCLILQVHRCQYTIHRHVILINNQQRHFNLEQESSTALLCIRLHLVAQMEFTTLIPIKCSHTCIPE